MEWKIQKILFFDLAVIKRVHYFGSRIATGRIPVLGETTMFLVNISQRDMEKGGGKEIGRNEHI